MKIIHLFKPTLLLSLLCLLITQNTQAQRFGKGERGERIKALWVAFITQELELTAEESKDFWPIYEEYKTQEHKLTRAKRSLTRGDLNDKTEAELEEITLKIFEYDVQLLESKKIYFNQLKDVVSIRKILMLPKVERAFKKQVLAAIKKRKQGERG
ncbi:MAG: hypothetical protein MK212_00540 [Saprospiraceae bacterium]|nr:hypothetical protein [Saprospiraceae bacterium]